MRTCADFGARAQIFAHVRKFWGTCADFYSIISILKQPNFLLHISVLGHALEDENENNEGTAFIGFSLSRAEITTIIKSFKFIPETVAMVK